MRSLPVNLLGQRQRQHLVNESHLLRHLHHHNPLLPQRVHLLHYIVVFWQGLRLSTQCTLLGNVCVPIGSHSWWKETKGSQKGAERDKCPGSANPRAAVYDHRRRGGIDYLLPRLGRVRHPVQPIGEHREPIRRACRFGNTMVGPAVKCQMAHLEHRALAFWPALVPDFQATYDTVRIRDTSFPRHGHPQM